MKAGERQMKCFDIWTSKDLHICATIFNGDSPLLITFSPAAPTREPFGGSMLRSREINHIAVTSAFSDWWQYEEIEMAGKALHEVARGFPRVVHYGSSMGGFGALFFSGLVEPDTVLAVAPQFSIKPNEPPFEKRWIANVPRIESGGGFLKTGMSGRVMQSGQIIAVYDPLDPDAQHIAQLEAVRPVEKVHIPHGGHGLLYILVQMGLASRLVLETLDGSVNPGRFSRLIKKNRNKSNNYMCRIIEARNGPGRSGGAAVISRVLAHQNDDEAGRVGQMLPIALALGKKKLAAKCLLAQFDSAITDGAIILAVRMRTHAKLLVESGLVPEALALLDAWIDDARLPDERLLAKVFVTLRRYGPADPLGSPRVRSAMRMMKWSGTPDTIILSMIVKSIILQADGRTEDANKLLSVSSGLMGGWHPFNLEVARTWDSFGDPQKAITFARRVFARDPMNEQAGSFLAGKLESCKKFDEAARVYRAVLAGVASDKPTWPAIALGLARNLKHGNDLDGAMLEVDRVLEKQPKNAAAWRFRVNCLAESGELDRAIAACGEALSVLSVDAWIEHRLARLELARKKKK